MHQTTQLASGLINGHDRLTIELIEPANHPPVVRIAWPGQPSIVQPARFDQVAAEITRIIAAAATRHNQDPGSPGWSPSCPTSRSDPVSHARLLWLISLMTSTAAEVD